ncbi:LuxR C-terminal-related transcriptional regulator [Parasphingorhabdus pacifica]
MATSYRQALDTAIAAMMREAIEHSVALKHAVDQITDLVSLRVQLGDEGADAEIDCGDRMNGTNGVPDKSPSPGGDPVLNRLTRREREVLEHLVRGSSNRQIARSLGISERTVKNHLHGIFTKLDVTDRTSAAVKALTAVRTVQAEPFMIPVKLTGKESC